jgi:divalent metal cation (Fe/Co/Zn/Cd) transporter
LIGQSADKEVDEEITSFLEARPEIENVLNLITLQLGAQIMVAVKAKMAKTDSVDELINNINRCEAALKKHNHSIQWIFFEPDIEK